MIEPAASFLILLPPGWARLSTRPEDAQRVDQEVRAILDDALPQDLPRDSTTPFREELRRRLLSALADAGAAGANGVLMPVRPTFGITPAASIIEAEIDDPEEVEPSQIITQLLEEGGIETHGVRDIDGGLAARTETTIRRVRAAEDLPEVDDHRVIYTISVPHRRGRWIVMTFSAITPVGADPQLGKALVSLFDAMMTTFRWIDVPGSDPTELELRFAELGERPGAREGVL